MPLLTAEDTAAAIVAAAVWAPSVHNTQPWWFAANGPELSLYADCGRQLPVADPDGREMLMSCGAALFTARLTARSLGWIPRTALLPDPADPLLVARVSWAERAAPAGFETRLFGQVQQRRTHRGGFDPVPLAPQLLTAGSTAGAPVSRPPGPHRRAAPGRTGFRRAPTRHTPPAPSPTSPAATSRTAAGGGFRPPAPMRQPTPRAWSACSPPPTTGQRTG